MKNIEKYKIEYAGDTQEITLKSDGTLKCNCKFYKFGSCFHTEKFKENKVRIIEAKRLI